MLQLMLFQLLMPLVLVQLVYLLYQIRYLPVLHLGTPSLLGRPMVVLYALEFITQGRLLIF